MEGTAPPRSMALMMAEELPERTPGQGLGDIAQMQRLYQQQGHDQLTVRIDRRDAR